MAAAAGLAVLQVLALLFHLSRGETKDLWLNAVLVVWGIAAAVLATSVV